MLGIVVRGPPNALNDIQRSLIAASEGSQDYSFGL
jgi:hypothetical protein